MIRQRLSSIIVFVLILLYAFSLSARQGGLHFINKSHLLSLAEKVYFEHDSVYVIDIYSDYPTYRSVEAKGEGFACVDDAARAIVFLVNYDKLAQTKEDSALITGLARFLLKMQTSDGRFYNFVERIGGKVVVNRTGITSQASFGWWAARAIWGLGTAAVYFKKNDRTLYSAVVNSLNKTKHPLDSVLSEFGKVNASGCPTWLIYGDGADVSSELLLGLNEAYRATKDLFYLTSSEKIAQGLLRMQRGKCDKFPFSVFMSNRFEWHAWANSQSAALLDLYRINFDPHLLNAALREVNCFLPRWTGALFFRGFHIDSTRINYNGQIAYNIRPALMAAVEAYRITRIAKYKTLSLLISSWFFGNNTAKVVMYSKETGICFDGIEDSLKINRNSGAESTIEALYSMLLLNKAGITNVDVKSISKPSLNAGNFTYSINGRKLELMIAENGFRVSVLRAR
ncbi:MAG: hypothetical protein ACP5MI_11035 [Candidatus Kryptoniota bacterium]